MNRSSNANFKDAISSLWWSALLPLKGIYRLLRYSMQAGYQLGGKQVEEIWSEILILEKKLQEQTTGWRKGGSAGHIPAHYYNTNIFRHAVLGTRMRLGIYVF